MMAARRLSFGGSLIRPEATGYGLVYFVQNMLEDKGDSFKVLTSLLRAPLDEPILQLFIWVPTVPHMLRSCR
jgi:hypothetical protein